MQAKKKNQAPAKTQKVPAKTAKTAKEKKQGKAVKPVAKRSPKKDVNQLKPQKKDSPKPVSKAAPKTASKPTALPKPSADKQPSKTVEKEKKPAPAPRSVAMPAPVAEKGDKKEKKSIKVGDLAPDFTLKDQFGNDVKLSALRGKKVLLSFHPLAWTPICELQMRSLELKKSDFDKLNTVPLGISVDSMHSKREWATFIELDQVQILADFWPHGEVAKKYGQFIDKGGVSGRVNILVDENGKVVWMKVYDIKQVPDIEEVLSVIREKSAS